LRAVILFSGDAARDEREKGLPRRFLSRITGVLASAIASMPDVDLIIPRDAAHAFRRGGASNLGACIANELARAFDAGYSQVAVIAGDVPGMRRAHIERAFAASSTIGPSRDGGFYLASFDRAPSVDWTSLPWCTSSIFDALHALLPSAEVLEVLDDVDSLADARRALHFFPQLAALLKVLPGTAGVPPAVLLLSRTTVGLRAPPRAA
jgi:hypothetical protein